MTKRTAIAGAIIGAAMSVPVDADAPRKHIQLLPLGKFTAAGWGDYQVDGRAHAEAIIAATRQSLGQTQLMGDYDHQLLYAAGKDKGGQAIASAWMDPSSLVVKDDGIWGDVEWTPLAEQRLRDREYRYISPTFFADKQGRIQRLLNFALVNTPAIKDLAAAAAENLEENDMKAIAAALGLSETATEAEILAAINKRNEDKAGEHLAAAAEALGLGKDADGAAVVAAAAAAKTAGEPDPTKFAPISMVQDLQNKLGAVVAAAAQDKAVEAVDAAIAAGKVQPAHRDHWLKSAAADLAGFEAYVAASAVIVPIGDRVLPGKGPNDGDVVALSDSEKALCAQFGWDEKTFLETKQKENA